MSASAQQFKVNEETRTIRVEDLPELVAGHSERSATAEDLLGVKMRYHFTEGQGTEDAKFDAMTIEWPDGLRVFVPAGGVVAIQKGIELFHDSRAVFDSIHEYHKEIVFCYEVV